MQRCGWLVLLGVVLSGCSQGLAPATDAHSLAEARSLSASRKLPILIEVSTEGCSPCAAFDRASKSDPSLKQALERVVLLRAGRDAPADLHSLLKIVAGFPTFIVLDQQGREIDRWLGYGDPDEWRRELENALAQDVNLDEFRVRHALHPSIFSAQRLARIADDSGDTLARLSYLDQALTLPGNKPPELWREHLSALVGARFEYGKSVASFEQRLIDAASGAQAACDADADCILVLVAIVSERQMWCDAQGLVCESLLEAVPPHLDQTQERRRVSLRAHVAWELRHDESAALSAWQQHFDARPAIDPESALAFADWVFEERIGFVLLEQVCLAALEHPRDQHTQGALLDAVGEARFNLGRMSEAIESMERAAALDTDNPRHADTLDAWRELAAQRASKIADAPAATANR